jgi:hypothetical protein
VFVSNRSLIRLETKSSGIEGVITWKLVEPLKTLKVNQAKPSSRLKSYQNQTPVLIKNPTLKLLYDICLLAVFSFTLDADELSSAQPNPNLLAPTFPRLL